MHCVFEGAPCLESTILNAERVDVSHPGVHIMRRSGPVDYVESVTSLAATGALGSSWRIRTAACSCPDIPSSRCCVWEARNEEEWCATCWCRTERTPFWRR